MFQIEGTAGIKKSPAATESLRNTRSQVQLEVGNRRVGRRAEGFSCGWRGRPSLRGLVSPEMPLELDPESLK